MSYGYQPLFTSTLNTNIMKPYQVFNSYVPTIPLKGYKGNMTFIGAIDTTKDPINSGVLINSTLMSEIGVSVDLITFTTKINGMVLLFFFYIIIFFTNFFFSNFSISKIVTPIPILGIESPFIGYTTVGTVSLFYASFRNSYDYQFSQFQYFFISNFNEDWPYGFISGTNSNFSHQVSFPRPQFLSPVIYLKYYFIKNQERFDEYIIPESSSGSDSIPPILKSYNFTRITNFNYLFSLDIESVNGVKSISVYSGGQPIQFSVISGTIYNGSFELIISFVGIDKFEIKDTLLNSLVFNVGTPFSANPLNVFNYPQSYDYGNY